MVAREMVGMMLLAVAGLCLTILLSLSSMMHEMQLPYFRIMGTSNIIVAILLLSYEWRTGKLARIHAEQVKWIFLRGFGGMCTYGLSLLAHGTGAPQGNVSALTSINLVAAAMLGRVFLGEHLRCLHAMALVVSVVGALLVSDVTSFLSEDSSLQGRPLVGYIFAVAAGFANGTCFIAARKSQGISPVILTSSVSFQEGVMCLLLPLTGNVQEAPMDYLWASPVSSLAVFVGSLVLVTAASSTLSAGSQLCPAAMSSTIFTSVSMSASYASQIMFQGHIPTPLSLLGAALMLSGVVIMALARWFYASSTVSEPDTQEKDSDVSSITSAASTSSIGSDASLASFVASEFSGVSLRERLPRKARIAKLASFVPQTMGAAMA